MVVRLLRACHPSSGSQTMLSELDSTSLVGGFKTIRISNNDDTVVTYRVAINNKEESVKWLRDFSRMTRTEWIVGKTFPNTVRFEYLRKYQCAFSNKNKRLPEGQSNRNYNCEAALNIKIKLLTTGTRKKDKYLREEPPLRGVITVLENHCHDNNSSSVLQFLRPGKDLRETFEEYFLTMTPAAALAHHEAIIKSLENGPDLLGNGQYMPLKRTVYWWHREWKTVMFGPLLNPEPSVKEDVNLFHEKENQCTEESRVSTPAECSVDGETPPDLGDCITLTGLENGTTTSDLGACIETFQEEVLEDVKRHLCRICGLRSEELSLIFCEEGTDKDNISLEKKIKMYLPIELHADDGLPLNICPKCCGLVESWHELHVSCLEADSVLRQKFAINKQQAALEEQMHQIKEESCQEEKGKKPSGGDKERFVDVAAESRKQGGNNLEENSTTTIGNCRDFVKIRRLVGNNYLLTCQHCSQRFPSVLECSQHRKQCAREPSICEICGKSVRERRNLKFHREQHFFVPVLCEKCGYQLESKSSELHHEEKCPGRGRKRKYFCEPCCKVFSAERSFKVHEEQHKKVKKNSNLGNFSLESCTVNDGEVSFICPVCCGRFEDKLSLVEHMNTNVKSNCLQCGKSLQNEREVVLHNCRKWTCP